MHRNTNILITSAGKRVELVLEFQRELQRLLPGGKVLTTELCPELSPAAHVSDGCITMPRVTDPTYIDTLLATCLDHHVGLIVPTIDTELMPLARARELFATHGIAIAISDTPLIATCRDKRLTAALFEQMGIPVPAPRDKHAPIFPMFAKPYDGSLSCNLHIINTPSDLTPDILADPKLIFMELIDKTVYKEYTVDIYYGSDHCAKAIVPRERLAIRAGEINKGATRRTWLLPYLHQRISRLPGARGPLCMQLFVDDTHHQVRAIEINPRFGGGYPLTYYAGANFPAWLISEYLLGNQISYTDTWRPDTIMLRYDSQIII